VGSNGAMKDQLLSLQLSDILPEREKERDREAYTDLTVALHLSIIIFHGEGGGGYFPEGERQRHSVSSALFG